MNFVDTFLILTQLNVAILTKSAVYNSILINVAEQHFRDPFVLQRT
jgi:hypothetical protein